MITYNLMRGGSDPLYLALYRQIKADIGKGVLKSGERLPSKRPFAANLGVSVVTVENAYAQLMAEGYIYSIPKRGFYVADFRDLPAARGPAQLPSARTAPLTGGNHGYFADFSSNQTASDLFPFTIWSKVIREVLHDNRAPLMTNSPCGGVFALRESIAQYLKDFRGMSVRPEHIIIGAGTEYLYGLLIQLLGADARYAVENPGYRKPVQIYHSFRMPCAWIPMDEAGIRVPELEASGANIVHITPSHQYPTGIVMPISRRYELLAWAARQDGRYILEDDYDSELRLSGQPIPTLQSIDLSGKVIYLNTFTKTLCSTVRISYMILPPQLADAFYARLSFYSCTVSNFEQYTLARFIAEGKFETHLNRLRSHYRRKRDALLEALQKSPLRRMSSVSGEEAGFHFLLTLHTALPQDTVLSRAQAAGIRLSPLSAYVQGDSPQPNVYVMNYSSVDAARAAEIWRRLYHCLRTEKIPPSDTG